MPQQRLFVSASFAVLQDAFVTAVQTLKAADPLIPLTILVPTDLLATHLRRAVASAGQGHLGLYACTLIDFVREVAEDSFAHEGRRPLLSPAATLFVKKLLDETNKDNYFAPLGRQPGFFRSLLATMTDLKQALIRPQDLRMFSDQAHLTGTYRHKIESLRALYEGYTNFLEAHLLYDNEDLLERAASLGGDQAETAPLFLYGFSDLTPLQRRCIEAVVKGCGALVFFPWRSGSAYENATPLLGWFTSLGFQYTALTTTTTTNSNLARLQTRLFESVSLWSVESHSQLDDSVILISAPGESREAREVGRAILDLVREENLHFDEIAVLVRDPVTYGPLLCETLMGLGIPCVFSKGLPLLQTHAGQSLVLLCQALAEDYSRTRMMEFLHVAHPPFVELLGEGAAYAHPARWDTLSLKAGIVRGAAEWRERLSRLRIGGGQRSTEDTPFPDTTNQQVLEALIVFMERFVSASENLPPVNTWRGWTEQALILFSTYVSSSLYTDQVIAVLTRLGRLDLFDERLSLQEWLRVVVETLQTTATMPIHGEPLHGVFIGDLYAARGVPFRVVIIPGLIEGQFPRTIRQDPLLLDAERQHIGEVLLCDLRQRSRLSEEEKLTFAVATQSATERLILTYSRQDQASGRTQLPSSYALRVVEAMSGQIASPADLKEWSVQVPLSPLYAGPPHKALDALEFHLASVEQVRARGDAMPLGYLPTSTPFFSRAFNAVHQRWDLSRLTPFDGMIEDKTVNAVLNRYLFPVGMRLSASALETYARCPFRYFLITVLGLFPQEDPAQLQTINPRDRGTLLHVILHDFFTRLRQENRLPVTAQDQQELGCLLRQVANEHFQAFANAKATGLSLLWELEQERMHEQLALLLKGEYEGDQTFSPATFEAHFGVEEGSTAETFFPPGPVRFAVNDGEEIALHGCIDRIDVSADGQRARVIDYKSGKPIRGRFAGGTALQLPLYLLAARLLRPDLHWVSAEYAYINHLHTESPSRFPLETWDDTLTSLRVIVEALIRGMREGCFTPTPDSCRPCPFSLICGSQVEAHAARKKNDTRLDFLRQVRTSP